MSRLTVDEIQSRIASVVDQDEDTSNILTADYSLRLKYINMAQKEAAEIQDWQYLFTEYNTQTSTTTGNASIALPNNFRKLAGYPFITHTGTTTDQFSNVLPQDDHQYFDTDYRTWLLGSPQSGYVLRVFGVSMQSGASIKIPYFRSPMSLASPTDITDIPNADYLVQRTVAWIWESREDARFPQAKADAERILSNMIEYQNVFSSGDDYDRVKTVEQTKNNFRIGRD